MNQRNKIDGRIRVSENTKSSPNPKVVDKTTFPIIQLITNVTKNLISETDSNITANSLSTLTLPESSGNKASKPNNKKTTKDQNIDTGGT